MEQAGLIRFLYSAAQGQSYLRNPIKMYPENTNLIYAANLSLTQDQEKGKVRETFVINQIQNLNIPVFYSPKGDFKIKDYIFEVGGKNKNTTQLQGAEKSFVLADDLLIGSKKIIPLYLMGLLY